MAYGSDALLKAQLGAATHLLAAEDLAVNGGTDGAYAVSFITSKKLKDTCEGSEGVVTVQDQLTVHLSGTGDVRWDMLGWSDTCEPVFAQWRTGTESHFSYAEAVKKFSSVTQQNEYPKLGQP